MRTEVKIPTPDGDARAYAFHPDKGGPWPAVIFFMDAPAIRPALFSMCERLASHGYFVLLPDMFWRVGPYEPINLAEAFKDEEARRKIFGKFMSSTDPRRAMRDTGAFLDWLSTQPRVTGEKVGVTGYCMGGGLALRAAGAFPDLVGLGPATINFWVDSGRMPATVSSPRRPFTAEGWPRTRPTVPISWPRRSRPRSMSAAPTRTPAFHSSRPIACVMLSPPPELRVPSRSTPAPAMATPRPTCRCSIRRPPKGTGENCSDCSRRR